MFVVLFFVCKYLAKWASKPNCPKKRTQKYKGFAIFPIF